MRWLDPVAIEFVSPFDVGWNFGAPPWSISGPASGRKNVVLPDCFDAPLDEIAAKLNEYRDRALGGATGGPEATA